MAILKKKKVGINFSIVYILHLTQCSWPDLFFEGEINIKHKTEQKIFCVLSKVVLSFRMYFMLQNISNLNSPTLKDNYHLGQVINLLNYVDLLTILKFYMGIIFFAIWRYLSNSQCPYGFEVLLHTKGQKRRNLKYL